MVLISYLMDAVLIPLGDLTGYHCRGVIPHVRSYILNRVRRHNLDRIMKSFRENSSPIVVFCSTLQLHRTLDEILFCRLNTTHVDKKFVRPYTSPICDSKQLASILGQVLRLDLVSTLGNCPSNAMLHLISLF